MDYDCVIVGGGIAGLQAAVQLGRYERRVLVADAGRGRSTRCRCYRNLLGWPDGVSGETLRGLGRQHAERFGVMFVAEEIVAASVGGCGFLLRGSRDEARLYEARTLLLATGLIDRTPPIPGLEPCLGLTVYVCPDCDGYEVKGRRTIVLGAGTVGAEMALQLSAKASETVYVNHEMTELPPELERRMDAAGIRYAAEAIESVDADETGQFAGVMLRSGVKVAGERGFVAFGGNRVRSELAQQLGVERLENRHIQTDPRTKMTNVRHVWAAGDVAVHAEQVAIAMGEGAQAAIWIHKALTAMEQGAGG
ncbi:MAG: NAD(P)/FAD-dependent oxidoreductase [Paenibacillaceae bacterium]|nr:NAD(P)/FAD-dependent oxidoreductase [Paenibacillaceae bacterium]